MYNAESVLPRSQRKNSKNRSYEARKEVLSKRRIPVWCNIRKNHLHAVSRHCARFVLIHAGYEISPKVSGHGMFRVGRDCIRATAIPCDDIWLLYVSTKADVNVLPARVRRSMSAMYSMVDQFDFSDLVGDRYLRRVFEVSRNEIAHSRGTSGPVEGEFPRTKVTAEHHTHYRPEEVWEISKNFEISHRAMAIVLKKLRCIAGMTEAAVSTFLVYMLYARPQVAYLVATSQKIWAAKTIDELSETLKSISVPLKSMQNVDLLDMSQVFELQCLVNRGIGKINWNVERRERTEPDVVDVDVIDVYEEAREIFREGVRRGFKYPKLDIDKYIDCRWEWVPTGSVHSQYEDDKPYIKKAYRHRTKFVALNMMPADHVRRMMKRPPSIHAWASIKYEWAKQRAIYGVDVTNSVITNFAMYRCEEVFKHRFPVGEEASALRVHKRLRMMLDDNESFCYDFDNFNAQHSTQAMYAVLTAYKNVFENEMSVEQKEAMSWVCESVLHVKVHNNEEGREEMYRPTCSLLSGWRLTTFINTALNYIYFKLSGALDGEGVKDSVHNGDDVLMAIRNINTACLVHKKMADINARAQVTKCNVFSIGEFLRVEHKTTKETGLGAQYLTRSSATMAHSRIESQEPTRLTESVKAAVVRCEEMSQRAFRGDEVSYNMLTASMRQLSKIFGVSLEDVKKIVKGHTLTGGASDSWEASVDYMIEEKIEYEPEKRRRGEEDSGEAHVSELLPGITDYAKRMTQIFGEFVKFKQVKERITSATVRQLAVTRRTWLVISDVSHDVKYKYGRTMFRLYRELVDVPHLEKARFIGISPIAMLDQRGIKRVKNLLSGASDVYYTLKALL